ncbi:DUF6153 family protein [Streptomyces sp. NPDC012466]|uniref:DUF6153 family protein n=1 Tax=Streptomyces sp. NPDC012466 TaxID=3364835 RepID=UPI0036E2A0CD
MNSPEQRAPRPAVRRWRLLCVLGLLAGLLGMHGLAPGGGLPRQSHGQQARALPAHGLSAPAVQAHALPLHAPRTHAPRIHLPRTEAMPYGHCGEGHGRHADATCASGAVSGGPVLPPPVADPVPVVVTEAAVRAYAVADTDGARAPPTLAELQLLRI